MPPSYRSWEGPIANSIEPIRQILLDATEDARALQERLAAGEHVSEEEMTAIARRVAEAVETSNRMLLELLGPFDSALLREKMVEHLTPEQFDEWSRDNAALQEYRAKNRGDDHG